MALTRRQFVSGTACGGFALAHLCPRDATARPAGTPYAIGFSEVSIRDGFWQPKMQLVATVTLPACIRNTEEKTGRIRNFEKVARGKGEKHEGLVYDDSDVYKALEAMAYSLRNQPDPQLEAKADAWIDKIAAAQLPDGYLNTYFTLGGLDHRWTAMEQHEDYNAGHLIEAAVAYYRTTGKRKFLDVAIRLADHIDGQFRVADRHWVSGHEEIELALMKLYHVTREPRYLLLADWYLNQRGKGYGRGAIWDDDPHPKYCQDDVPVREQRRISGHAVRAMYLYSSMADVAAVTHDSGYLQAMHAVWSDLISTNMYVTGGIGSSGSNEGFTDPFDLPNDRAYCETCASVGMVFWNHRMALLSGDSRYADIMERSLYNGALDGLSLGGDHFFYANPLASGDSGTTAAPPGRKEWFGTACCPANIARLVASIGSYIYTASEHDLWVNLFIGSSTTVTTRTGPMRVETVTDYPWDGRVSVTLTPQAPVPLAVRIRLPGWSRNEATPGGLYRFVSEDPQRPLLKLNGRPLTFGREKGHAVIDRTWHAGDVLELTLPMPVRTLTARNEVVANRNRLAIQRGPLVYCAEGTDNPGGLVLSHQAQFVTQTTRVLTEKVVTLTTRAEPPLTAIPYYTWANRGNFNMEVWLREAERQVG